MQKRKVYPDPIIEHELYDDEELLWQGKPNPMGFVRRSEWIGVVMGLFFAAFGAFFIHFSSQMFNESRFGGPPAFVRLMFIFVPSIFILTGLYQAAQPLLKFIEGKGTTYGLTNKRAIIITKTWSKQVRSY